MTNANKFYNCTFGIQVTEGAIEVSGNNEFHNCTYGIYASSTYGEINAIVNGNNLFSNNHYGIVMQANAGGQIEDNYFEGNKEAIILDGANQCPVRNNLFASNDYNVISAATGGVTNVINCNDIIGQAYVGIGYLYDNNGSTFQSNNFDGLGEDLIGHEANIYFDIGFKDQPAMNLFNGSEYDIDWDETNKSFNYHILEVDPPERSIPQSDGNYVKDADANGPGVSCETVLPPVVTEQEINTAILDYCYWLWEYRNCWITEQNNHVEELGNEQSNQNNGIVIYDECYGIRKKYFEARKTLYTKYYYWKYNPESPLSWRAIEIILKRLCGDRWRMKLYGVYMKHRLYTKADSILNILENPNTREYAIVPEDLSDESRSSFIEVQKINLKYQQSGRTYELTEAELATLYDNAVLPIPESAYAKALYKLVTGEYIGLVLPEKFRPELEPREDNGSNKKIWSIYPNPAYDVLHVEYSSKEKLEGTMAIYNLLGSKVLEKTVIFTSKTSNSINISSLKEGVYIFTITDRNNKPVKTEKLILKPIK